MALRTEETSPALKARLAGAFYLVIFLAAAFAEFVVRGKLIVDDPAATAANISGHELLYRSGGIAQIITISCDAAVALLFYDLLKPVSKILSLSAMVFRLLLVAGMAVNLLNHFAALDFSKGAKALTAFNAAQLQALMMESLRSYNKGFLIVLVFFGLHCVLIGYLVLRSIFLPRILGALYAIAGLVYLINSFANLLVPTSAFASSLFPVVLAAGAFELLLTLWLLIMGVNVKRWYEQAGVVGA